MKVERLEGTQLRSLFEKYHRRVAGATEGEVQAPNPSIPKSGVAAWEASRWIVMDAIDNVTLNAIGFLQREERDGATVRVRPPRAGPSRVVRFSVPTPRMNQP